MVRSCVIIGSKEISLLISFGVNSGWLVEMTVEVLSTLNLNRISCKAYLSSGRRSINDKVDSYTPHRYS